VQAGRSRVALAQLCLAPAWRDSNAASKLRVSLRRIADHLARGGAKVDVLIVADAPGAAAELRLRWVAWHAPPLASFIGPETAAPVIDHPYTTGESTMKLPFSFLNKSAHTPDAQQEPQLPALAPQAVPTQRRQGAQLPLALAQIAEHIAHTEVHDLQELGMQAAYRLSILTFWVSAANQPALRNLMEINQRDPGAARRVLQAAFAKTRGAAQLDTRRLALAFTPGDNLPRDAAEVLIVCGRDTVALPYSYEGEIDLLPGNSADPGAVHAPPSRPPSSAVTPQEGSREVTPLCLWLHTAGRATPQRWFLRQAAQVGADGAQCEVVVDWSRVSGQHLRLTPSPQGGWQVQDDSRNGTLCLDAEHAPSLGNPPERPLPKGQPTTLPRAGSLRLGVGADDPLLHYAQLGLPPSVDAAAAVAAPAAPSRRVTELGPAMAMELPGSLSGERTTRADRG
jgi:hypothetical protein